MQGGQTQGLTPTRRATWAEEEEVKDLAGADKGADGVPLLASYFEHPLSSPSGGRGLEILSRISATEAP